MVPPHPSPNFGERRAGARPSLIVLHYTGMASCAAALDRLCDPQAEVSAHYLISQGGEVLDLVHEAMRAWHAGAGEWAGISDVNSHSIGIELANTGAEPFAHPQMLALEQLLPRIMARWSIAPHRVIAHSDLAPGRKRDPGPRFDWRRLAQQGLSVWPDAVTADLSGFAASCRAFGYPDVPPDCLLAAFRLRFRPWATGPVTEAEAAMAQDLAQRFPVDRSAPNA